MGPFRKRNKQVETPNQPNGKTPRKVWGQTHGAPQIQPIAQNSQPRKAWGQRRETSIPSFSQVIQDIVKEPSQVPLPDKPSENDKVEKVSKKTQIELGRDFDPTEVNKYLKEMLEGEEIKRVYYRHWIKMFDRAWWMIIPYILLITAFLLTLLLTNIFLVPTIIIGLIVFGLSWFIWNDYRDDRLIVTNIRIIQKEKVVVTKDDDTNIRFEKAQEVSLESNRGMLEWLFKIGTITITSIGKNKIVFDKIQYPELVRRDIDEIIFKWRMENNEKRKQRTANRMETRLQTHYGNKSVKQEKEIPENKISFWQIFFPSHRIETYDERGRVTLTWHTHPWILIRNTFSIVIQTLFLIIIYLLPLQLFLFPRNIPILNPVLWILFFTVLIIQFMRLWFEYIDWVNDRYMIKPDEYVTMKRLPFGFDQSVGAIKLISAQDVQIDKSGLMANLLNFGTVTISSAGGGEPLKFLNVPNPDDVEEEVSKRLENAKTLKEDIEDGRTIEAIYNFFKLSEDYRKKYTDYNPPNGG